MIFLVVCGARPMLSASVRLFAATHTHFTRRSSLYKHLIRVAALAKAPLVYAENVSNLMSKSMAEAGCQVIQCAIALPEIIPNMRLPLAVAGLHHHSQRLFLCGLRRDMDYHHGEECGVPDAQGQDIHVGVQALGPSMAQTVAGEGSCAAARSGLDA